MRHKPTFAQVQDTRRIADLEEKLFQLLSWLADPDNTWEMEAWYQDRISRVQDELDMLRKDNRP